MREAYSLFKETFPCIKIGKSSFAALKPNFIKPYKDVPQNVCICCNHENFETIHKAVGDILPPFDLPVKDFIDIVCCDTSSYECMNSNCEIYHDTIKEMFEVEVKNPDLLISYSKWKTIETACGKHFERITVEETISDGLDNLRKQLPQFLLHTFVQTCTQQFLVMQKVTQILRKLLCKLILQKTTHVCTKMKYNQPIDQIHK